MPGKGIPDSESPREIYLFCCLFLHPDTMWVKLNLLKQCKSQMKSKRPVKILFRIKQTELSDSEKCKHADKQLNSYPH